MGMRGNKLLGIGLLALIVMAEVSLAGAQESARDSVTLNIDAQPLGDALTRFAEQSGLQVLLFAEVSEGITAPRVAGTYTPQAALQKLLANTELQYEYINDRTVAIRSTKSSELGLAKKISTGSVRNEDRSVVLAQAQTENQTERTAESDSSSKAAPLEEIVVTAEKREENIQSLPIAISAFSGETLTNRGIGGLADLPQLAPSMQILIQPGQDTFMGIRGISTEVFGGEPAVALSRDGVSYASTHLFPGDFFDVERVEVLRGPQGTISGRNATAGAINVHSNRPTDVFEGGIKATFGNYERFGTEGFLSGPIAGDRLLGRLAVLADRADGWVTNTVLNQELGAIDKVIVRPSLLARLGDNFEAHLILEGIRDRSTPIRRQYVDIGRLRPDTLTLTELLGVPEFDRRNRTTQLDHPYNFDNERYQATLKLTWQLGPSAQLTAITGYVDQDQPFGFDNDGTRVQQTVHNELFTNTKQASQEVTLTADLAPRLDLISGALYLRGDKLDFVDVALPLFGLSVVAETDEKLTSWAGYTQFRYRLTDEIRLTAGARYTHDTKDFARDLSINSAAFPRVAGDNSWDAWTPRFTVDYAPSEDLTLYASVSRGFKSGGNQPGGALEPLRSYNPEFVWNYEAGVKADSFDGRLKTALSGFYMDYTDLQQFLFVFDATAGGIRTETANAESATIRGVELEVDALATDRLRFTFAGTWLDATYGELQQPDPLFPELGAPLPEAPGGPNFRDLSGNQLVRSPEWQFNVSGEYRTPLGRGFLGGDLQGLLRVSYAWQDRVFFDIFNRRESGSQRAYGLINLFGAIETTDGRWQLSAFVHNLADQSYSTQLLPVVGSLPVPFVQAEIGEPRRYGISLAYRF